MRNISLLGASGSIGQQTIDVLRNHPHSFRLVALSVGRNVEYAAQIVNEFQPLLVSVQYEEDVARLRALIESSTEVTYGEQGLTEVATLTETDVLVNAVMGSVGLNPTLQAIEAKKTIAIANKETLVTAGHLVTEAAKRNGVDLIPVDSEHSAIYQCLEGNNQQEVERYILTASGGSFRDRSREELKGVTVEDALKHPNWNMGAKITIDSATMMNKGLEVIEAHWLFSTPYERIDVLLHKESMIHSLVEYIDGSVLAHLGSPDMRVPIQYALSFPKRLDLKGRKPLNLWEVGTLHFEKPDADRFRCLKLAYEAGKEKGTAPTVLNAANEAAVAAFLEGKIPFLEIETLIEKTLDSFVTVANPDLETIQDIDLRARRYVQTLMK
ncbi:1-deoxy-D-xylulose-5-phosphate reductoisomerase [Texcoconibacillus texcoconensis]|uniref:1-deoxy-D-xylulose 5-phosphate reductoisomerase n=1 Tax=Texcoconibacillus texcoconensis TaxID=1095777 RepID=A0A840QHA8_9BACI|nr:1-deoxy-D-xylulose-5-phosphate reductoisomerase [Texcoconibacillus texcoconensis]MBB5172042.1 1-deoxy-D-xylulose-5-phosphate reductoisomerase [Texcoconibacillus texcoconensis]